jgi:hypothetical protein
VAQPLLLVQLQVVLQASNQLPWILQDGCQSRQLHAPASACLAVLQPVCVGLQQQLLLLIVPLGGCLVESQVHV